MFDILVLLVNENVKFIVKEFVNVFIILAKIKENLLQCFPGIILAEVGLEEAGKEYLTKIYAV